MATWLQIVLGSAIMIAYAFVSVAVYKELVKRSQRRFLNFLRMQFPDAIITFRSVSAKSEQEALHKLIWNMQNSQAKTEIKAEGEDVVPRSDA